MLNKEKLRELFFEYVRKLDGDVIASHCEQLAAQHPDWDCPAILQAAYNELNADDLESVLCQHFKWIESG